MFFAALVITITAAAAALMLTTIIRRLSNYKVPGSPLGKLSRWHYEYIAASGQMAHHALRSSKGYPGPIQQIQPTSFSLTHPRDIRQLLGTPSAFKSPYYGILKFTSTNSLLSTTDAQRAGQMRRVFNPYFSNAYLLRMEPLILAQGIGKLMHRWDRAIEQEGGEVNFCDAFNLAAFSIISNLVFGREISEEGEEMRTVRWMADATTYISLRAVLRLLPDWLFGLFRKLPQEQRHYMRMRGYVERAVEHRRTQGEKKSDLLQALVDCMQPPLSLTPEDVLAEAFLLLIGGIDPTAYTLTWTLHLLMLYPEHLGKAQSEVRSLFPSQNHRRVLGYAEIKGKLPFLDACILESMRLVPVPCVQIPRTCPAGLRLRESGAEVPPGCTAFANIWGSHHAEAHWAEPSRFDPMRFVDNPRLKHAVFAFGHGTRLCMGKGLAMMNMTVILANILRTYNLALPPGYTFRGPSITDKQGVPRLMPMTQLLTAKPRRPDRDCRLIIAKHTQD
ncbi:hypothetical protein GGI15_002251 [Coemansia interrupta]|uniref:Cytochrome P450 n=1 Tax=Coemansia interrupta TaxID=1126814 RepID=A0A9W8LL55_9FUNG|nr:hypothetical protein GGI15_002251 [Coemansia interrupta]